MVPLPGLTFGRHRRASRSDSLQSPSDRAHVAVLAVQPPIEVIRGDGMRLTAWRALSPCSVGNRASRQRYATRRTKASLRAVWRKTFAGSTWFDISQLCRNYPIALQRPFQRWSAGLDTTNRRTDHYRKIRALALSRRTFLRSPHPRPFEPGSTLKPSLRCASFAEIGRARYTRMWRWDSHDRWATIRDCTRPRRGRSGVSSLRQARRIVKFAQRLSAREQTKRFQMGVWTRLASPSSEAPCVLFTPAPGQPIVGVPRWDQISLSLFS